MAQKYHGVRGLGNVGATIAPPPELVPEHRLDPLGWLACFKAVDQFDHVAGERLEIVVQMRPPPREMAGDRQRVGYDRTRVMGWCFGMGSCRPRYWRVRHFVESISRPQSSTDGANNFSPLKQVN
jgi:hypothetical protein